MGLQHIASTYETYLITAAEKRRENLKADEYIDVDGLIYCKNCNTPREKKIEVKCKEFLSIRLCDCQQAAEAQKKAEEEKAAKIEAIEKKRCRYIPVASYRSFTFASDDGQTPAITTAAKKYVENFERLRVKGHGLIFFGGVGTGKTYFAMVIANALIDRNYTVRLTSLSEVIRLAQDFDNAADHFGDLMANDAIIIDDLGTERETTFAEEKIYEFVDGCNTRNIPLIITTNLVPSELEAAAADMSCPSYARIYSRLLEKCLPVKVNAVRRRENNTTENRREIAEILGLKK